MLKHLTLQNLAEINVTQPYIGMNPDNSSRLDQALLHVELLGKLIQSLFCYCLAY